MAFIDSQIYIHQLCSIKNFILVGDVMKSVDLLEFQQDYRTLAVISRDPRNLEVSCGDLLMCKPIDQKLTLQAGCTVQTTNRHEIKGDRKEVA